MWSWRWLVTGERLRQKDAWPQPGSPAPTDQTSNYQLNVWMFKCFINLGTCLGIGIYTAAIFLLDDKSLDFINFLQSGIPVSLQQPAGPQRILSHQYHPKQQYYPHSQHQQQLHQQQLQHQQLHQQQLQQQIFLPPHPFQPQPPPPTGPPPQVPLSSQFPPWHHHPDIPYKSPEPSSRSRSSSVKKKSSVRGNCVSQQTGIWLSDVL